MTISPTPAVLELVRARRGQLELIGEHVRRLLQALRGRPAAALFDEESLAAFVRARWQQRGGGDGVLRLEATNDEITVAGPDEPAISGETLAAGFSVGTSDEPRAGAPPYKSADHVAATERALRAARGRGRDELLLRDAGGAILGAASANLFLVARGEIVTPSLARGAFPGILRRATLIAARELGVAAREADVTLDDVALADDAFLTSSSLGIVSIRAIDGRPLAAPPLGSPQRALVPRLRLRVHLLLGARFLPA